MKNRMNSRNIAFVLCILIVGQLAFPMFSGAVISSAPSIVLDMPDPDAPKGPPYEIHAYYNDSAGVSIDGVLDEWVWTSPSVTYKNTTLAVANGYNVTIRAFHNLTHLFIGIEMLNDTVTQPNDYCEVCFDVDHDGASPPETTDLKFRSEDTSTTDNYLLFNGTGAGWGQYSDNANNPNPWPSDFLSNATIQAVATYEFVLPISAAWGQSSPAEGNITGFCVHTDDKPNNHVWWPDQFEEINNPTVEFCDDASTYGDLIYHAPIFSTLDHIQLTPQKDFPVFDGTNPGGVLTYTAVGWNDAGQTEKNSTWTPAWGTTDGLGAVGNLGGNWNTGFTADYTAGLIYGFDNVTIADATVPGITNASCIQIIPNQLHHINLTPMNVAPANITINIGNTTSGYTAVGWNDAAETEKNLTWTPTWGTTDGLGTAVNFGGDANTGFTANYTAGAIAGYDNITVENTTAAVTNQSCIFVNASVVSVPPLDHIELTPMFAIASPNIIGAGQTIAAYTAIGWNDVAETDKNSTWTPVWGTTDGMGLTVNSGGNWNTGYTIDYQAGVALGYDNITVRDNAMASITNATAIEIVPDTPSRIRYVSGNGQHKLPGETLDNPFVVSVEDQYGNMVPNVDIEWGLDTPFGSIGHSLSLTTSQTNESGIAATTLTLGNALGGYFVNATNSTLALTGEPIQFMAEARPPPIHIAIIDGDDQTATAGTTLPIPLTINVTYDDGTLVGPGVPVWFNVTSGSGTLNNASVFTNTTGVAQTALTFGNSAGEVRVTAEVSSFGVSSVTFNETSTLPDFTASLSTNITMVMLNASFAYQLTFDNTGTESAHDLWVNMTMPGTLVLLDDTSGVIPARSTQDYSWHFTNIPPGPNIFRLVCGIADGVTNGTTISNHFTVDYTDQTGKGHQRVSSNTAQITVFEELEDNMPPTIEGVPDLIIHHDWDYRIDLSPYISDNDTEPQNLTLIFSDTLNARIDPNNNLAMILNYSIDYLGTTKPLNITVSDGQGSDWDMISVKVTDDFPPEVIAKIPDIFLNEDSVAYPFNINHYFFDRDGDSLIYTYGEKNANITFLANSTVMVTPKANWFGVEKVTFRALDPSGALIEDTINITVNPVNDAPVIGQIPDQSGEVGVTWVLNLADYGLADVDDLLKDLNITTDSQYVTVNGLNLTFRFSEALDEIVTVTISDGKDETFTQINVAVTGSSLFDDIMPFLVPIIALLSILFIIIFVLKRRFIVEQAFIIYKDGSLIAHASNREIENQDADIFTSMLTAIQDFVKDSFTDEADGSLKRLEFGDSKIHFERDGSGNVSAALVYKGSDDGVENFAEDLMNDLNSEFSEIFKDWNGNLDKVAGARQILLKHFER